MSKTVYLLTGAAGNLGSSIARQLVAEGKEVRALVLRGDKAADKISKKVDIVTGDVTDLASIERFFSVDSFSDLVVIHCASIVTVSPSYSQKVYDVNVTGTKNIVDKCVEHKAKKLVYISSTSAIPELPDGETIVEVDRFDPDAVIGFYGKTKAEASQLVMDAVLQRNLDASIVFPSGIAGPGDYAYGPVASFIIDCVKGEMKAGIAGSFNAVDVRDLANGVISCVERGVKGEGYIMANAMVTMQEMFHLISSLGGVEEVKTILPVPLANFIARLSGLASKVTGKSSRMTTFAVYNLARNNSFGYSKAVKELGYTVRPFAQTVSDTIAWLKSESKI
jgi:dihydroflavonol-4-reductase